ncbi:hypothetical protein Droror1_Dr00016147 [Drosera rotundifolia]
MVSETINLNEDTLWTGIPGDYTDPNALQVLDEVRKLVNEAKYIEATNMADKKLSGQPPELEFDHSDAVYVVEFDHSDAAYVDGSYLRELDLNNARGFPSLRFPSTAEILPSQLVHPDSSPSEIPRVFESTEIEETRVLQSFDAGVVNSTVVGQLAESVLPWTKEWLQGRCPRLS